MRDAQTQIRQKRRETLSLSLTLPYSFQICTHACTWCGNAGIPEFEIFKLLDSELSSSKFSKRVYKAAYVRTSYEKWCTCIWWRTSCWWRWCVVSVGLIIIIFLFLSDVRESVILFVSGPCYTVQMLLGAGARAHTVAGSVDISIHVHVLAGISTLCMRIQSLGLEYRCIESWDSESVRVREEWSSWMPEKNLVLRRLYACTVRIVPSLSTDSLSYGTDMEICLQEEMAQYCAKCDLLRDAARYEVLVSLWMMCTVYIAHMYKRRHHIMKAPK